MTGMFRIFVSVLICWMAVTWTAEAHKDRVEKAWKVTQSRTHAGGGLATVAFKNGANARFHVAKNGKVTAVSLQSGKVKYDIPAAVATKLREVHYGTASLGWDGDVKRPGQSKYVYLEFDMGTAKKFGELPSVQLMFENGFFHKGKFVAARLVKKSGPETWQSYPL